MSVFKVVIERTGPSSRNGSTPASPQDAARAAERTLQAEQRLATLREQYQNRIGAAQARHAKQEEDRAKRLTEIRTAAERNVAQLAENYANRIGAAHYRAQKQADDAAKRSADLRIAAERRVAQQAEDYANRVGAAQAKAAQRAADAAKRERDRNLADAKRAAEAEAAALISASDKVARSRSRALTGGLTGAAAGGIGALRSIGGGLGAGVSTLGAGIRDSVGTALSGDLVSGSLARAAGSLASSAVAAGSQIGQGLTRGIASAIGGLGEFLGGAFGAAGGAIGKLASGLASSIGSALSAALSVAGNLAGTLTSAAGEIAGFLGDKIGGALKVALAGALGTGAAGLVQFSKLEAATPVFEQFARASGKTATEALEKFREATRGTVSDTQLMVAANRAAGLGIAGNVDAFANLTNLARNLGRVMDKDVGDALNRLVLGIGKAEPELLDELGIVLRQKPAFEAYAFSIGKSADELTVAERQQAVYNETVRQGQAILARFGEQGVTTKDGFDQLQATLSNVLASVGRALAPAFTRLAAAVKPVVESFGQFFDNNSVAIGSALASAVEKIGAKLQIVAQFVRNARIDEVFTLASLVGQKLWVEFEAGARKAINTVDALIREKLIAGMAELGAISGRLFGTAVDAVAGGASLLVSGGRSTASFGAGDRFAKDGRDLVTGSGVFRTPEGIARDARIANRSIDAGADPQIASLEGAIQRLTQAILNRGTAQAFVGAPAATAGTFSPNSSANPLFDRQFSGVAGGGFPRIQGQPDRFVSAGPVADRGFGTGSASAAGRLSAAVAKFDIPPDILPRISEFLLGASQSAETFGDALDRLQKAAGDIAKDDAVEALLGTRRKILADDQGKLASLQSVVDETRKREESLFSDRLKLIEEENERTKKIRDAFTKTTDAIQADFQSAVAQINQATKARQSQLEGLVGGLDATAGVPRRLARAAEKVRREKNRDRKNSLNQLSAGLSSDELAANGGALLSDVFAQQAAKETDAGARTQAALADAMAAVNKAASERAAQQEELAATLEEESAALDEKEQRNVELHETTIKVVQDLIKKIEKQEKDLERLQRVIEAAAR